MIPRRIAWQLISVKRRLQPLDAFGFDNHHVEAARGQAWKAHQVMLCRKNYAPLLGSAHARSRTSVALGAALAHLRKHGGAIGCAQDQVNFATATAWGSIIAHQQAQTLLLQIVQRGILRSVTLRLACEFGRKIFHERIVLQSLGGFF